MLTGTVSSPAGGSMPVLGSGLPLTPISFWESLTCTCSILLILYCGEKFYLHSFCSDASVEIWNKIMNKNTWEIYEAFVFGCVLNFVFSKIWMLIPNSIPKVIKGFCDRIINHEGRVHENSIRTFQRGQASTLSPWFIWEYSRPCL